MEVAPFKDKIQKQHEVVIKQFTKFRMSWQGKTLPTDKIESYCNLVTYLSNLNYTYINNCAQYFTPSMKQQTLSMNKSIIQDMMKKIKHFQPMILNDDNCLRSFPKQAKEICYVCASKIREVDIKLIKEQLAEDASLRMSLLKKIYSDLENENAALFTKDEDQVFFKFLNRILIKKEEVLAMQTREISEFLKEVTKSFSDLNLLAEYQPVKFGATEYKENYQQEMENMITKTLKTGFNGKVHPWVHKVFESMRRQITKETKVITVEEQTQTQEFVDMNKKRSEYTASNESRKELQVLKEEVQRHLVMIDDLKTEIAVLTKQKKDLEEYYTKEMNELQACKKSIEQELKKTETDFFNLKTLKDTEIFELNKKLANERKKTEPNPPTSKRSDSSQILKQNESQLYNQLDESSKEDAQTQFKKKKTNLNRLFSNKPDHNRGPFINKYKSTTQFTNNLNSSTMFKNNLTSHSNQGDIQGEEEGQSPLNQNHTLPVNGTGNISEVKDSQNSIKIADEFLKQIKFRKNKRNSKVTEPSQLKPQRNDQKRGSKHQIKRDSKHQARYEKQDSKHQTRHESKRQSKPPQEYTPKVDFKLDPLIGCREDISVIVEQANQTRGVTALEVTGSAPKMSKRKFSTKKVKPQTNNQKKNKRQNKRNLSIQMKIPPIMKAGQSIYKPRNSKVNVSDTSHMISSSNGFATKGAISSKEKVFKYVPLENQEYESLKEKVNEVTTRIEARNGEKLKQSIRYTKEEFLNQDVAKVTGFSVFSKKFTKTSKDEKGFSRSKGKSRTRIMDKSRSKESDQDSHSMVESNMGIVIQAKSTKSKSKSKSKTKSLKYIGMSRSRSRRAKPEVVDCCMQTESIEASSKFSLIDQVTVHDRKNLFATLSKQAVINPNLSFHHYEMIVRKLFAQQKAEMANDAKLTKSRVSSLNHNDDKKDKKKESVKINIDARFFEGVDSSGNSKSQQTVRGQHNAATLNRGKLLLNLPKLSNGSSSLVVSGMQSKNSLNSTIMNQQYILQVAKTNKSPFNTLRESKTHFKHEYPHGRHQQVNSEIMNQLNQQYLEQTIKEDDAQNNHDRNSIECENQLNQMSQLNPLRCEKYPHPNTDHIRNHRAQSKCISASRIMRTSPSPSAVLQPINPKKTHVFGPNDIKLLFESELLAFEYEQLVKVQSNPHFNCIEATSPSGKAYQLSKQDVESVKSLHQVLNQIKQKNSEIYYKVCSFVKSPYQAVRGGFDFINTAKDLSLDSWTQYLTKIYGMRRTENQKGSITNTRDKENSPKASNQTSENGNNTFSAFLRPFEQKLIELLIMAQKV